MGRYLPLTGAVMILDRGRGTLRAAAGCAMLAVLSACAESPHAVTSANSTEYYLSHAAHDYSPPGPPDDPWGPYINIASSRFDVPQAWIRQVMRVESGGHEYTGGQLTVSAAGAMGLMQLEPATYQEMAARYGLGQDPFNPYDNIMAGAAYIHEMYQVYGSPGFLAAYNAGPGRLDAYIHYRATLPQETKTYVAMIAPNIQGAYPANRSPADQFALNTLPASSAPGILPPGFNPYAPAPSAPSSQVEVAALAPRPMVAPEPEAAAPDPVVADNNVNAAPLAPVATQPVQAVYTPPPAPEPVAVAYAPPPAPAQPVVHHNFSIISPAVADTLPAARHDSAERAYGGWAIQVGAYDTAENARAAIGLAELSAVRMLVGGHATVQRVEANGRFKYRARIVGLPHDDAVDACGRLGHSPTGCEVLSPDAL